MYMRECFVVDKKARNYQLSRKALLLYIGLFTILATDKKAKTT